MRFLLEAGLTVERIDRLTPLTIPIGPRPETALRLILGEGAGATAEGAEEGAAVEAFMQSLRFVQTELDCHVLLEEHHVPGRPGFSEEVIDGVVRHSLLLRLAVRRPEASDPSPTVTRTCHSRPPAPLTALPLGAAPKLLTPPLAWPLRPQTPGGRAPEPSQTPPHR